MPGSNRELSHAASCCPLTHVLGGEQRLVHKDSHQKANLVSLQHLPAPPPLCCPGAMGPFLFLCLLTSPPFPALQGIRNGFYHLCLLMTQCLLVPVTTAAPCAWGKLKKEALFPPSRLLLWMCCRALSPPASSLSDSVIHPLFSRITEREVTRTSVSF